MAASKSTTAKATKTTAKTKPVSKTVKKTESKKTNEKKKILFVASESTPFIAKIGRAHV